MENRDTIWIDAIIPGQKLNLPNMVSMKRLFKSCRQG